MRRVHPCTCTLRRIHADGRGLRALAMLAVLVLLGAGRPAIAQDDWETRSAPGLRLDYSPVDRAVAERLWAVLPAERTAVREALRLFPTAELRVVLAPTEDAFRALLAGTPPHGTLGVYLLGEGTIVLRSPRTAPGGDWDVGGVLRHELAHAVIDQAIAQPVPLWLHEGLAILVAAELSYLDEAQLTTAAVLGRLIPLPVLFESFPREHGARNAAYAQGASFVRFLLRAGGMGGLQRLLEDLARGLGVDAAFLHTYGEPLADLEARWQEELAGRFSTLTLITTSSVLGGLGLPLLLLAMLRRALQRRRAYRAWEREERARAALLGIPGMSPGATPQPASPSAADPPAALAPRRFVTWRPPRPRRDEGGP